MKLWRAKTARKEMMHRLLIVIDEAANVAPMPALRRHVGEGRGLGVNLLLAVQASSQFDTVYGSAYANELRDIFPAALILFGAPEMELLRRAEEWSLQTTRRSESFDQAAGRKPSPRIPKAPSITGGYCRPTGTRAACSSGEHRGVETELLDWSEFVPLYDEQVKRFVAARSDHGAPAPPGGSQCGSAWRRVTTRRWSPRGGSDDLPGAGGRSLGHGTCLGHQAHCCADVAGAGS